MDDRVISEEELDALLAQRDPIDVERLAARSLASKLTVLREEILQKAFGLEGANLLLPSATVPVRLFPKAGATPGLLRRRRLAARFTVGAAFAAAVSLVGINVLGSSTPTLSWLPSVAVAPAQAAELNSLASAAALVAGPGKTQWLYQRYEVSEGTGEAVGKTEVNVQDHRTVQRWTSSRDVQRTRSVYKSFTFDSPRDRANFYGADHAQFVGDLPGAPGSGIHVTDEADPSLGPSPLAAQNMPRTKLGILHRFQVLFKRDPTGYTKEPQAQQQLQFAANFFGELALILADSTSGRQRAAALRDFAYIKGVQMRGAARDALGRPGIEIRYVWHRGAGQVNTLIIDPKTGDLLQETSSELHASRPGAQGPGFPIADGQQRTTYLQRAIVNSMTALPGGGHQPYHGIAPRIAKGSK
jgi:hypothetical protein